MKLINIILKLLAAVALLIGLYLFWDFTNTFVSEKTITFSKEIDRGIIVELGTTTGEASTAFNFNQLITPRERGVQKNVTYAYRVLNKSGNVVIPVDKWPLFTNNNGDVRRRGIISQLLESKNIALGGTFNFDVWLPLNIGNYTIQLVRINKPKGIIVAEKDFSIVPYDQKTIAQVTSYLSVEGDSNKYYDGYDKKGNDSITVWVQSPKGVTVSGTLKFFMTNAQGEIEKTSWIGVVETKFNSDPNGNPVALRGLSGNPARGIYHFQIIINDYVVSDLKYYCGVH